MKIVDYFNIIFLTISSLAILLAGIYWCSCFFIKKHNLNLEVRLKQIYLDMYGEWLKTDGINNFKSITGESFFEPIGDEYKSQKYNFMHLVNLIRLNKLFKRDIKLLNSIKKCIKKNTKMDITPYEYYFQRNDCPVGKTCDASNWLDWKITKFDYLNGTIIFSKCAGIAALQDQSLENRVTTKTLYLPNNTYIIKTKMKRLNWTNKIKVNNKIIKINKFSTSQLWLDPRNQSDSKFRKDCVDILTNIGFIKGE